MYVEKNFESFESLIDFDLAENYFPVSYEQSIEDQICELDFWNP